MSTDSSFNILVVPAASSSVFVDISASLSDSGDSTFIDSSLTNGKPSIQLQVTQNWNPGGVGGGFNAHAVGVWYDSARGEWAIFNEDGSAMATGLSFNVMVGADPSNGGKGVVLKTKASNVDGDHTFISNARTTGNPNNVVFATQNWDPGDVGGISNNQSVGVFYAGGGTSQEAVFNESAAAMPNHAAFNLLIFSS